LKLEPCCCVSDAIRKKIEACGSVAVIKDCETESRRYIAERLGLETEASIDVPERLRQQIEAERGVDVVRSGSELGPDPLQSRAVGHIGPPPAYRLAEALRSFEDAGHRDSLVVIPSPRHRACRPYLCWQQEQPRDGPRSWYRTGYSPGRIPPGTNTLLRLGCSSNGSTTFSSSLSSPTSCYLLQR